MPHSGQTGPGRLLCKGCRSDSGNKAGIRHGRCGEGWRHPGKPFQLCPSHTSAFPQLKQSYPSKGGAPAAPLCSWLMGVCLSVCLWHSSDLSVSDAQQYLTWFFLFLWGTGTVCSIQSAPRSVGGTTCMCRKRVLAVNWQQKRPGLGEVGNSRRLYCLNVLLCQPYPAAASV